MKRAFILDNAIGTVQNGRFYPVRIPRELIVSKMREIITRKKFHAPEPIVQQAVMELLSCDRLQRVFEGKLLSDSQFYQRCVSFVRQDEIFQTLSREVWDKFQKRNKLAREARKKESMTYYHKK